MYKIQQRLAPLPSRALWSASGEISTFPYGLLFLFLQARQPTAVVIKLNFRRALGCCSHLVVHLGLGPFPSELEHRVLLVLVSFHLAADLSRHTHLGYPLHNARFFVGRQRCGCVCVGRGVEINLSEDTHYLYGFGILPIINDLPRPLLEKKETLCAGWL